MSDRDLKHIRHPLICPHCQGAITVTVIVDKYTHDESNIKEVYIQHEPKKEAGV